MTNESVISEECKQAALNELIHNIVSKDRLGSYVQALLNASTARLRESEHGLQSKVFELLREKDSLRLHLDSEQNANRANVKVIAELREERDAALNSFHAANKERMAWKDKPVTDNPKEDEDAQHQAWLKSPQGREYLEKLKRQGKMNWDSSHS